MREKHILIITDNENSEIVRLLSRHQVVPVTRSSIMSAIDLLRHSKIIAIVVDKENQNVDTLEFILNARDVASDIPIYIPKQFQLDKNTRIIKEFGNIMFYQNNSRLIKNDLGKYLN